MSGRKQLMGVIARNLPTVPSVLADAILGSKWLAEHDRQVRVEILRVLSDKYATFTSEDPLQRLQFASAAAFMAAEAGAIEKGEQS